MSYTVKIWDKRPTRFHAVVCDTEAQADEVADTEMIIALIALRRGEDATSRSSARAATTPGAIGSTRSSRPGWASTEAQCSI